MKRTYFLVIGLGLVCAVAIIYGANALSFVTDAYPKDRLRADALDRCSSGNTRFFRFSEREREGCYAQVGLPSLIPAASR